MWVNDKGSKYNDSIFFIIAKLFPKLLEKEKFWLLWYKIIYHITNTNYKYFTYIHSVSVDFYNGLLSKHGASIGPFQLQRVRVKTISLLYSLNFKQKMLKLENSNV